MKKKYETPRLIVLGDIKQITQQGNYESVNGNGRGKGSWMRRWGASG